MYRFCAQLPWPAADEDIEYARDQLEEFLDRWNDMVDPGDEVFLVYPVFEHHLPDGEENTPMRDLYETTLRRMHGRLTLVTEGEPTFPDIWADWAPSFPIESIGAIVTCEDVDEYEGSEEFILHPIIDLDEGNLVSIAWEDWAPSQRAPVSEADLKYILEAKRSGFAV